MIQQVWQSGNRYIFYRILFFCSVNLSALWLCTKVVWSRYCLRNGGHRVGYVMMAVRQSGNLLVYWTYRGPSIWLQVNYNHYHHHRRRLRHGHHHQPPHHHHDIVVNNVIIIILVCSLPPQCLHYNNCFFFGIYGQRL